MAALPPVALITGASKGIGLAVAHKLAQNGYSLALSSRSGDALQALVNELSRQYPQQQFLSFVADLSQPETACAALVQAVLASPLQKIDVLVNNAGVSGRISLLTEISDADVMATLALNLAAPVLMTKHVLPHMVQRGAGHIVNISSVAGKTAFPYWSVYCASKFGLSALAEAVGEEQRQNGIKVCTLHPGAVDTPLWDSVDANAQRDNMLTPDTVANAVWYALSQPEGAWVSDITLKPLHSVL
jgi:short-subunit dehydrogenase